MKTTEGLLLCPACNGKASFQETDGRMFVECQSCNMRGPSLSQRCKNLPYVDAKGSCIAAWNALPRRADIERV